MQHYQLELNSIRSKTRRQTQLNSGLIFERSTKRQSVSCAFVLIVVAVFSKIQNGFIF